MKSSVIKSDKTQGYTIDEVKEHMEKYVDESAERLRRKLRAAWKKQKVSMPHTYENSKA